MEVDDLDIYNDLDNFQEEENKKSKELLQLEAKCSDQLKFIESLQTENAVLKKNVKTIEVNLQNLLDTAKAEIKRKDKQISELRQEIDDICFRRKQPGFAAAADVRSAPHRIAQETGLKKATAPRSTSASVAIEHTSKEVNSKATEEQEASSSNPTHAEEQTQIGSHERPEHKHAADAGKRRQDNANHEHNHYHPYRDRSPARRSSRDAHKSINAREHSRQQDRGSRERHEQRERDTRRFAPWEDRGKRKRSPVQNRHSASMRESRHHKKDERSSRVRGSSSDYSVEKFAKERRGSTSAPKRSEKDTPPRKEKERRRVARERGNSKTDQLNELKNDDTTNNINENTCPIVNVFDSGGNSVSTTPAQSAFQQLDTRDSVTTCTAPLETSSHVAAINADENSNLTRTLTGMNTPRKAALYDSIFGHTPSSVESLSSHLRTNDKGVLNGAHDAAATASPSSYTDDSERPTAKRNAKQKFDECFLPNKPRTSKLNKQPEEAANTIIVDDVMDAVEEFIPGLGDVMPFEKTIGIFGAHIDVDADKVELLMENKEPEVMNNNKDELELIVSDDEYVDLPVEKDNTPKTDIEMTENVETSDAIDLEQPAATTANNVTNTTSQSKTHNEELTAKIDKESPDAMMKTSAATDAVSESATFVVTASPQQEINEPERNECKQDSSTAAPSNENTKHQTIEKAVELEAVAHSSSARVNFNTEINKNPEQRINKECDKNNEPERSIKSDNDLKVKHNEQLESTKVVNNVLELQTATQADQAELAEIALPVEQVELVDTTTPVEQVELVEKPTPIEPVELVEKSTTAAPVKSIDNAQDKEAKIVDAAVAVAAADSSIDGNEQLSAQVDLKENRENCENTEYLTSTPKPENAKGKELQSEGTCEGENTAETILAIGREIQGTAVHIIKDLPAPPVENETDTKLVENNAATSALVAENGQTLEADARKSGKQDCTALNEKENKTKKAEHKQKKVATAVVHNKVETKLKTEFDINSIKKENANTEELVQNRKQDGKNKNVLIENMKRAEIMWKYRIPKLGAKQSVKKEVLSAEIVLKNEEEHNVSRLENTTDTTTIEQMCDNAEIATNETGCTVPLKAVENKPSEMAEHLNSIPSAQIEASDIEVVKKPTALANKKTKSLKRWKVVTSGAGIERKRAKVCTTAAADNECEAPSLPAKHAQIVKTKTTALKESFAAVDTLDKVHVTSSSSSPPLNNSSCLEELQPQPAKRKRCKMRIEDSEDECSNAVAALLNHMPVTVIETTRDEPYTMASEEHPAITSASQVLATAANNSHDEQPQPQSQPQPQPLKRKRCKMRIEDSEDEVVTAQQTTTPPAASEMLHRESFVPGAENDTQSVVSTSLPSNNTSYDEKFREIDSRLQSMFESPCKVEALQQRVAELSPTLPSPLVATAAAVPELATQTCEFNVSDTLISDIGAQSLHNSATTNLTIDETNGNLGGDSSLNDSNGSVNTKHISLGSSDYRFEKVSDNVVNLFITRKRRGKTKTHAVLQH